MSKLHEILAVEADTQGQYKNIFDETLRVFKNEHLFKGFIKTLTMFDEKDAVLNSEERSEIATTVPKRLEYTKNFIIKYLDVVLQKEATNQTAFADIVIDGITIAEKVPTTFLLGLESKLKEIRKLYERIPTLEVSVAWEKAEDIGDDIWRQKYPEEALRTKKQFLHQILVEPTNHHPAQIEKWEEQVAVGRYEKQNWSGMITSTEKARLLNNIDKLTHEVKKARQRGNNTEVVKTNIGKKLMDYIHLG